MHEQIDVIELALENLTASEIRDMARKELKRKVQDAIRQTQNFSEADPKRLIGHVVERLQRTMGKAGALQFHEQMVQAGIDPRSITRGGGTVAVNTLEDIAAALEELHQRRY